MAKNKTLQIRIEEDLKRKSEEVFDKLSISTSAAINLFLQQVVINQEIPFEIKVERKKYNGSRHKY